jgi:hypothetical protein
MFQIFNVIILLIHATSRFDINLNWVSRAKISVYIEKIRSILNMLETKNKNERSIYIGLKSTGTTSHIRFTGTVFHVCAALTNSKASNKPKPNLELTFFSFKQLI